MYTFREKKSRTSEIVKVISRRTFD